MRYRLFIPLVIWQLVCDLWQVPSYILPSPIEVLLELRERIDHLLHHFSLSLLQVIFGMLAGVIFAFITAIFLYRFKKIKSFFLPYLIGLKNMPLFAFAPLLMLWVGHGLLSKVLLIMLSCYFPMTVGLLDGFDRTPRDIEDLLYQLPNKSYLKEIFYIRLPFALPKFFTSMKLTFLHAPMSVIACDWIGAQAGLGYIMMIAYGQMDLNVLFGCLLLLLLSGVLLYKLSHRIEHFFINKLKLKYI